jgi:hypothetical protein
VEWGVYHAAELEFIFKVRYPYILGGYPHFSLGEEALSERMICMWSNFAATGNPAVGRECTIPAWPAYGNTSDSTVLDTLGTPSSSDPRKEQCDFLASLRNDGPPDNGSEELSTGAIAGVSVGAGLLAGVVIAGVVLHRRRVESKDQYTTIL